MSLGRGSSKEEARAALPWLAAPAKAGFGRRCGLRRSCSSVGGEATAIKRCLFARLAKHYVKLQSLKTRSPTLPRQLLRLPSVCQILQLAEALLEKQKQAGAACFPALLDLRVCWKQGR